MAASTGALFVSRTKTVNDWVALKGGEPLSVTLIEIVLVPGPCASVGVHANTPVRGLIVALVGAPGSSEKVSASPFASVAVLVKVSVTSSVLVRLAMFTSTGARLVLVLKMLRIPEALIAVWPS